jgi:hypothetical protein
LTFVKGILRASGDAGCEGRQGRTRSARLAPPRLCRAQPPAPPRAPEHEAGAQRAGQRRRARGAAGRFVRAGALRSQVPRLADRGLDVVERHARPRRRRRRRGLQRRELRGAGWRGARASRGGRSLPVGGAFPVGECGNGSKGRRGALPVGQRARAVGARTRRRPRVFWPGGPAARRRGRRVRGVGAGGSARERDLQRRGGARGQA